MLLIKKSKIMIATVRKYGKEPYLAALLHGGPGAKGDLMPVAKELADKCGILELVQTKLSIDGLIDEVHDQLNSFISQPIVLAGHSWGAWLAVLVLAKYPHLAKKLILISAGSFDEKYNTNLTQIRLNRLDAKDRTKIQSIIRELRNGNDNPHQFQRFGELMSKADSYDLKSVNNEETVYDPEMFQSVWTEAEILRKSGGLLKEIARIKCPVVAIHGDYDPHPVEGVEKPLSSLINDFRMIILPRCGHSPWKEKYAHHVFFDILQREITEG